MRFALRERRTEVGQKLLKMVLKPEPIKEVGGTMSVQSSTCLPAHRLTKEENHYGKKNTYFTYLYTKRIYLVETMFLNY